MNLPSTDLRPAPLRVRRAAAFHSSAVRPLAAALLLALTAPLLHAQRFVAEWSTDDIGRLGPTGLALDANGASPVLYVADQRFGRIVKYDANTGQRLAAYGQTGNGPVEFNNPFGVAIEPTTRDLYVAERGNNRVHRITNAGQFVMGWGIGGTEPGQFRSPIGIAADAAGHVYVVDHDNDRVQKFRVVHNGTAWEAQFVTAWGGTGTTAGKFLRPYGIALDAAGNVWVADGGNSRLQKFGPNGNHLATVGSHGTADGQFLTPTWISFDAAGAMYVAETNPHPDQPTAPDLAHQRIQKFNPDGTFALKWGTYGEAGGQFKLPFQVVVDAAGKAYVSDYYNTRVQKFDLNQPPPTSGGGGSGAKSPFVNVSTRLRTSADAPLIAGFVISGSAPKTVLIRAVGPTLADYGVAGALPNPKLQVYGSDKALVAENEDWGGDPAVAAAAQRLYAFALPAASKDAALLITLPPGIYTAQAGANGGDGVALVEVYDAEATTASRAINISTRGAVGTGDGVLVAGFIIGGTEPKRVLIRGAGPALTPYGVTGALANPQLSIYSSTQTLIARNNDWGTPLAVAGGPAPTSAADISAAASSCGAFPFDAGSADAAVVVTLAPGAYSAIISGVGETTGTSLAEVYELP